MSLTIKKVAKLTSRPGRYFDSAGLYLQVPERGKKKPRQTRASWLFRFEHNGRERWMGLGAAVDFSLDEARERARKARQLLADGIDPVAQRDAERRARDAQARKDEAIPTFKDAAERFFKLKGDKWRNAKSRAQFLSTLRDYVFPKLGTLRVNDVTTDDVLRAIEPIWTRIPETASRTRGRIENVLSWAIANKFREGPNPARWDDNLEHLLPARGQVVKVNHHAALPYAELPEFMIALAGREGTAARALELTILTAARTSEIIGATWDEIDLASKVWTVPAERMKAVKEHRVPLSDRALETLKALPREEGNDHVFVGMRKGTGLSNMSMDAVLRRAGFKDGRATVHGFRSTFRDWAAERTNHTNHVIEMALAHAIGNAVEAAYRRGDLFAKRVRLMSDWARYCAIKPVTSKGATVVPLRRD